MLFIMIRTIAVQGYRSLRDLTLPLGQLSLITGANGSGKSSVYRSLRLLADVALNSVVASLAREGVCRRLSGLVLKLSRAVFAKEPTL
jgi:predicted ATPase